MTLSAGTKLGPYEILVSLGSGGMGEVYRARDSRLGREVAVKVLPADLASNPERLKRFEREGRSASALNHPNIITVFDIGSDNSISYLAMELIDGKTLRQILLDGTIPFRKSMQIAVQLADGLAKAHAAGIVHRDLKPENVMISKDGFAKILDFSLSKSVAQMMVYERRIRHGPVLLWARWGTCHRNKRAASPAIFVPINSPSGRCCTRWLPASAPFNEVPL